MQDIKQDITQETHDTPQKITQEITDLMPVLHAYAWKLERHHENAEDLVQTCMLKALDNIDQFTPNTNLRAWLYTILKNTHANNLRKKFRHFEAYDIDLFENSLSNPPNQLPTLEVREYMRAAEILTEDNREILMLTGVIGLSYEETARRLNIPLGTVRSRLSRARSKIRTIMDKKNTYKVMTH